MLLRVLVVSGSPTTDRRLQRLLKQDSVLVEASDELWSGLARDTFDVLVISLTALPRIDQQIIGFHVREYRSAPLVNHRVGRRDKGQVGNQNFIAWTYP